MLAALLLRFARRSNAPAQKDLEFATDNARLYSAQLPCRLGYLRDSSFVPDAQRLAPSVALLAQWSIVACPLHTRRSPAIVNISVF